MLSGLVLIGSLSCSAEVRGDIGTTLEEAWTVDSNESSVPAVNEDFFERGAQLRREHYALTHSQERDAREAKQEEWQRELKSAEERSNKERAALALKHRGTHRHSLPSAREIRVSLQRRTRARQQLHAAERKEQQILMQLEEPLSLQRRLALDTELVRAKQALSEATEFAIETQVLRSPECVSSSDPLCGL